MKPTVKAATQSVLVFLAIVLLVITFSQKSGLYPGIKKLDNGQLYRILVEELTPNGKIRSIAEDSGLLYVFYDYAGLVNVYKTNGTFQYAIHVGARSAGVGTVAVLEHRLYIVSTENIIYCFDGRNLIRTWTWDYEKWKSGDTEYNDMENQIESAKQTVTESGFTISANQREVERVGGSTWTQSANRNKGDGSKH